MVYPSLAVFLPCYVLPLVLTSLYLLSGNFDNEGHQSYSSQIQTRVIQSFLSAVAIMMRWKS